MNYKVFLWLLWYTSQFYYFENIFFVNYHRDIEDIPQKFIIIEEKLGLEINWCYAMPIYTKSVLCLSKIFQFERRNWRSIYFDDGFSPTRRIFKTVSAKVSVSTEFLISSVDSNGFNFVISSHVELHLVSLFLTACNSVCSLRYLIW